MGSAPEAKQQQLQWKMHFPTLSPCPQTNWALSISPVLCALFWPVLSHIISLCACSPPVTLTYHPGLPTLSTTLGPSICGPWWMRLMRYNKWFQCGFYTTPVVVGHPHSCAGPGDKLSVEKFSEWLNCEPFLRLAPCDHKSTFHHYIDVQMCVTTNRSPFVNNANRRVHYIQLYYINVRWWRSSWLGSQIY